MIYKNQNYFANSTIRHIIVEKQIVSVDVILTKKQ
jgi:hypothetical protein